MISTISKHKRQLLVWLLIFAALTFIGIVSAGGKYLSETAEGSALSLTKVIRHQLGMWYTFGFLGILLVLFIRRFPFNRYDWTITFPVYAVVSFLFSALHTFLFYLPARSFSFLFSEDFVVNVTRRYPFDFLIFLCVIALYHAYRYFQSSQERELLASQMQARLVESQLQALKMQIQPHFLFNTLHSVASVMYEDVATAHEMITRLGDLLRWSLQNSNRHEVTLDEELNFLEHYIEIQKMRFGDRLTFTKDIVPEVQKALVPNFILQPLVENAIRHGVEPQGTCGKVEVSAKLDNETLRIQVCDNGPGMSRGNHGPGIGLSNCRERLKQLYDGKHNLELAEGKAGGLTVSLTIPFRVRNQTDLDASGAENAEVTIADRR